MDTVQIGARVGPGERIQVAIAATVYRKNQAMVQFSAMNCVQQNGTPKENKQMPWDNVSLRRALTGLRESLVRRFFGPDPIIFSRRSRGVSNSVKTREFTRFEGDCLRLMPTGRQV